MAGMVEEVAVTPPGFYRKFNRSAEVLHKVYIDKVEHDIIEESLCKKLVSYSTVFYVTRFIHAIGYLID